MKSLNDLGYHLKNTMDKIKIGAQIIKEDVIVVLEKEELSIFKEIYYKWLNFKDDILIPSILLGLMFSCFMGVFSNG